MICFAFQRGGLSITGEWRTQSLEAIPEKRASKISRAREFHFR